MKSIINKIYSKIIHSLYFFFYIIFTLHVNFLNTFNRKLKLIFTFNYGFGDYLFFCSRLILKLNEKRKIYCFSRTQYETARFFFNKRQIVKQLIVLPKRLSETHLGYAFLKKTNLYKPLRIKNEHFQKVDLSWHYMGNKKIINYIKSKISKKKFSKEIINFTKKKYICLFIKNFSLENKNNDLFFQIRQTRNLDKIYKLIKFLNKKKINILILGTERDHFIKLLPEKIKKLDNICLFKDLSKNYSIEDQAIVAFKSKGYIGSNSGANGFFGLLLKKHLIIDDAIYPTHKNWQNFNFLYKRIYNKKTKKIELLNREKLLNNNKYTLNYKTSDYQIIENSYSQIKSKTLKIFNL